MFQTIVVIASLIGCSAFVPQSVRQTTGTIMMAGEKSKSIPFLPAPSNLEGMIGNKGFDPVGFSDFLDVRWLREAELKHGRICMLATLGFVVTEFVTLPGDVHSVSSILAHNAAVSSGSAFQVLTAIAGVEFIACIAMKEMFEGSGRQPGDFSFDPLGLSAKLDQKNKDIMALKELENGRLAMVAFSGIVTQAVLTEHGFPYI